MIRISRLFRPTLALLLVGMAMAGGCRSESDSSGGAGKASKQTLVYAKGGDAESLDPIHVTIGDTVTVLVNLYDTLVTYDDKSLEIVPSLAESWTTSDDAKTWTFKLRPNVKFHDGAPFNAESVVFTFDRLLKENNPNVYHGPPPYGPSFAMIESVTALDPMTVEFKLKEPSAILLQTLAMFSASIVSPDALKKHQGEFSHHPAGTGPFKFKSWKANQEIVVEKFDEHWRGAPQLDKVVFTVTPESAVRVKQLLRGEAHIADNLPPAEVDRLAKNPELKVQDREGVNLGYLVFQNERPPLDDLRLREAICLAIDKAKFIKVAYSGQAVPAVGVVPPTLWAHDDKLVDRPFDVAKAKQLVEEVAKEKKLALPIKLRLFQLAEPRPYMPQPAQAAALVKDSLAEIGIECEVVVDSINQYFRRLSEGEHDIALCGWTSDSLDPDDFTHALFSSKHINNNGGLNMSRFSNAEFDAITEKARVELDQQQRREAYLKAQEILFKNAPIDPLAHTKVRSVQRAEVQGYYLHPASLVRLRTVYLGEPAP